MEKSSKSVSVPQEHMEQAFRYFEAKQFKEAVAEAKAAGMAARELKDWDMCSKALELEVEALTFEVEANSEAETIEEAAHRVQLLLDLQRLMGFSGKYNCSVKTLLLYGKICFYKSWWPAAFDILTLFMDKSKDNPELSEDVKSAACLLKKFHHGCPGTRIEVGGTSENIEVYEESSMENVESDEVGGRSEQNAEGSEENSNSSLVEYSESLGIEEGKSARSVMHRHTQGGEGPRQG